MIERSAYVEKLICQVLYMMSLYEVFSVQLLDNAGYTRRLIKHLYKLIMADYSAEAIMKLFSNNTSPEQIENFVEKAM